MICYDYKQYIKNDMYNFIADFVKCVSFLTYKFRFISGDLPKKIQMASTIPSIKVFVGYFGLCMFLSDDGLDMNLLLYVCIYRWMDGYMNLLL